MNNIKSFAIGNIVYDLFDSGLANILGLETLRHGTNLLSNIGIRINGGKPSHGGKASGSTKEWMPDFTEGDFYVFKDTECCSSSSSSISSGIISLPFFGYPKETAYRLLPHLHSILAGYNFVAQLFPNLMHYRIVIKCFPVFISCISGVVNTFISPILRFRFSIIDPQRFENDPKYYGKAYLTKQVIESWRLGLVGSFLTGINLNWFSRARAKPLKILTGIVQIACAIGIARVRNSLHKSIHI